MSTHTKLIHRSAVREYTFAILQQNRPHLVGKFTRISADFYEHMDMVVRSAVIRAVGSQPSSGKTIRVV